MRHRTPRLLFVGLCGLAPAALGNALHWPPLLWSFLCMVTASGSLLLVMTLSGDALVPDESPDPEPPAAPAERPYRETRVIDAVLPSATDGYDFLFSATVWWRPAPAHADRPDGSFPAVAESAVVSRALEVVRHEEPGRADFARYLLEGELSLPLVDRSGRVTACAADVILTLAAADRARLRRLTDLRKDEEVWEHERLHERNKRRYFGDDVLKNAGSAVVWWLTRHEDEIDKAVDMIGPLAQIAAAANNEEVPELLRHLLAPSATAESPVTVGGLQGAGQTTTSGTYAPESKAGDTDQLLLWLSRVGLKPGTDAHTVVMHRLARELESAGLPEAAEDIRRTILHTPEDEPGAEPTGEPWRGPSDEESGGSPQPSDWSPRESERPADAAADQDTGTGTGTGTGERTYWPGAAESSTGEQHRGQRDTNEHSWWEDNTDGS